MFRELFIAPIHMRAALRRCEHEGTPLRMGMRKRIEKPGDRRAGSRLTATRPAGGSPFPARVRFRICARRKHAPRRPAFVFVRSRHSKVHSKYESSAETATRLACPTNANPMSPRVPGMRFGFMLNKRSQRNYRGTVLAYFSDLTIAVAHYSLERTTTIRSSHDPLV